MILFREVKKKKFRCSKIHTTKLLDFNFGVTMPERAPSKIAVFCPLKDREDPLLLHGLINLNGIPLPNLYDLLQPQTQPSLLPGLPTP